MDFKALSIQTEAIEFKEGLHLASTDKCEVDFDLKVKAYKGQIVSVMDMQYYRINERLTPLASLRTILKFWVDENIKDIYCSERILFSLKTQHRFTSFVVQQKLKENNIDNFNLPTPTDEEFFRVVHSVEMAPLEFDNLGSYMIKL